MNIKVIGPKEDNRNAVSVDEMQRDTVYSLAGRESWDYAILTECEDGVILFSTTTGALDFYTLKDAKESFGYSFIPTKLTLTVEIK